MASWLIRMFARLGVALAVRVHFSGQAVAQYRCQKQLHQEKGKVKRMRYLLGASLAILAATAHYLRENIVARDLPAQDGNATDTKKTLHSVASADTKEKVIMYFDFCQANEYYVIPLDPQIAQKRPFWEHVDRANITLPIVNTDGNFHPTLFEVIAGLRSQAGTDCYVAPSDVDGARADGRAVDTAVLEVDAVHITIDVSPFFPGSEMTNNSRTLLLKSQDEENVPPKLVGDYKGVFSIELTYPAGAQARMALLAPVVFLFCFNSF